MKNLISINKLLFSIMLTACFSLVSFSGQCQKITAKASSTSHGGAVSRVVDGKTDGHWNKRSVMHTDNKGGEWVELDLGAVKTISGIEVYNRTDCCKDRIGKYYAMISDRPFPNSKDVNQALRAAKWKSGVRNDNNKNKWTISVPGKTGRYVRLQFANDYKKPMNLAEIKVLTSSGGSSGGTPKITAKASSTSHGGAVSRVVDGNTDGNWGKRSVMHTDNKGGEWVELDLGKSESISGIEVYNRTDCCKDRIGNYYAMISDNPFPSSKDVNQSLNKAKWKSVALNDSGKAKWKIEVPYGKKGRYVRLQLANDYKKELNLAEIRVLTPGVTPGRNLPKSTPLASGNSSGSGSTPKITAKASSVKQGGIASRVVDGNTDGKWSKNSVMVTDNKGGEWVELDLGSSLSISGIEVYNRTDCCYDQMLNYFAMISDQPFPATKDVNQSLAKAKWKSAALVDSDKTKWKIEVKSGTKGRYVRLQFENASYYSFNLAEIRVLTPGVTPGRNLPKSTPFTQRKVIAKSSSVNQGGDASRVVDGNTNGNWSNNSVMQTKGLGGDWVEIDLRTNKAISGIEVYTRTDCCKDQMAHYNVQIYDDRTTWRSEAFNDSNKDKWKIEVPSGTRGRFVKLYHPRTYKVPMNLAEIRVLTPGVTPGRNLPKSTLKMTATSSSVFYGGADLIIDGKTDGDPMFTKDAGGEWVEIDFKTSKDISGIEVYAKKGSKEGMGNYYAMISDRSFDGSRDVNKSLAKAKWKSVALNDDNKNNWKIDVPRGTKGRYVRLQHENSYKKKMALEEVRVLIPGVTPGRNLGKSTPYTNSNPTTTTTQKLKPRAGLSSFGGSTSSSSHVVDGNKNTFVETHNRGGEFINLDLKQDADIVGIEVYVKNGSKNGMGNYYAMISDKSLDSSIDVNKSLAKAKWKSVALNDSGKDKWKIEVPGGTKGRYLRLQYANDYKKSMSLAEIRVLTPGDTPERNLPKATPKK